MSQLEKLEADVEIKASSEKFHDVFCSRPHHISNVSPGNIQGCDLHDGEWGTVGSVICWNYVNDGQAKVAKEIVEAVDPAKNLIRFKVIEGDLIKDYKSFHLTVQASPKGEGSLVHWTLEYERLHEGIGHPETLLDLCVEVSKDIDAHLTSQA